MPIDMDNGTEEERGGGADPDSTQSPFSGAPEARSGGGEAIKSADPFLVGGKSIRLRPRPARGGLAAKIALPTAAAMLIGCLVAMYIVNERVFQTQLSDLKGDAAYVAYTTGIMGRALIERRNAFLAEHPDYPGKAEWRTGDHWLVTTGIVSQKDWRDATGFDMDEYAPVKVLEQAALRIMLYKMQQWLDAGTGGMLVAVYIVNNDGSVFASAVAAGLKFDPLALRTVPVQSEYRDIGRSRVQVDYIPNFESFPLVRSVVTIMTIEDPMRPLGKAVAILRVQHAEGEQRSVFLLAAGLLVALIAFTAGVCWLAAKRMTAPLRRLAVDIQAMAEGDFTRRSTLSTPDEIGMLAQAFNSMAERMRVARMNERETNRLESDLAIARSIQSNLLPPQTPRVRGFDIQTAYRPAKEIGGDYFDFLPVDSQHMGIVIADASGKSIPAALVMSTTRAILRFVAPGNNSAAETLSRVNAILSVDIPKGMFVTAYYLILDPLNSAMLCASAGHTPLLIARADGSVELMNPGGIALGFDNGPIFDRSIREQRVKLAQGDRVLIYTDGVVECVNPANEEYSDRRLREFLRRNRDLSSHDFVGALLADLDRHRGAADMRDDTTIVTFKVL